MACMGMCMHGWVHWWTYEPRIRLVYEQQVVYEARTKLVHRYEARTKLVRQYEARTELRTSLVQL